MKFTGNQCQGFSLIEVNLAIFVVAMGMLTLFSLFPAGLRQVETSQAATQEALFGDYILSTIRADARFVSAEDWVNMNVFRPAVLANVPVADQTGIQRTTSGSDEQFMRFQIDIREQGDRRRSIALWCKAGEFGPADEDAFRDQASKFYTEVVYSGMP